MSRYLIVTHKTAFSAELREKVGELVATDASAEFAILVPEVLSVDYSWESKSADVAGQRAESARLLLEETLNAKVVRTSVGSYDPLRAIGDELSAHPAYDTLVICTLPPGASRWLRLDLVHQAARKFGLPIIHVVAHSPVA
ncbi:MAG: hypothetical protein JOZ41_07755 [Chloroflexi bacterium]|nr:hypothetical protein [Chloroflexota bacterium]